MVQRKALHITREIYATMTWLLEHHMTAVDNGCFQSSPVDVATRRENAYKPILSNHVGQF